MKIQVLGSCGYGRTTLSAFDKALCNIGIHDYNLITLSSIIPPGSQVDICDVYRPADADCGSRLYVIMAEQHSVTPNTIVGAALGWYQAPDGRGMFVEHVGTAQEANGLLFLEDELAHQVRLSLEDMCKSRSIVYDERQRRLMVRTGVVQPGYACCALVVAIYKTEEWHEQV